MENTKLLNILTTNKCNLECNYCEFSCNPEGEKYIETALFIEILEKSKTAGINDIGLDGGEFLTHPGAKKILKVLGDLNFNVLLLTNGLLFEEFIDELRNNGINRVLFGIDSLNEKINDKIKGLTGCTQKTKQAINIALKNGFNVGLHLTLTRENANDIGDYLDYAKKIKANPILLSSPMYVGKMKENEDNLTLKPLDIFKIKKAYESKNFLNSTNGLFSFRELKSIRGFDMESETALDILKGCKYFNTRDICIDWEGHLRFCPNEVAISNPKFPKFSLKDGSLEQGKKFLDKLHKKWEEYIKSTGSFKVDHTKNHFCGICIHFFKNYK